MADIAISARTRPRNSFMMLLSFFVIVEPWPAPSADPVDQAYTSTLKLLNIP